LFVRFSTLAAICVAASSLAGIACAQATDGVEIALSATVTERCGFATTAPASVNVAADLEDAHSQSLALRIDCNTPFHVSARSEDGSLINRSASDDFSGYAFAKVYGVRLELETDAGRVSSGRCLSSALIEGGDCVLAQPGGLGSGDGVAIGRDATLTVDWPAQTTLGRRLAAGDYSDIITISIAARS